MGCGSSSQAQPPPQNGREPVSNPAQHNKSEDYASMHEGSVMSSARSSTQQRSGALSVIHEVPSPSQTPIEQTPRDVVQQMAREKVARLPKMVVDKLVQLHHVSLLSGDVSTLFGAVLVIKFGRYPGYLFDDFHAAHDIDEHGQFTSDRKEKVLALQSDTQQFFTIIYDSITKHGGDIIACIGDTLVSVFHGHESLSSHILRAVECAQSIVRELAVSNKEIAGHLPKFAVGSGNLTTMFFFTEQIRPGLLVAGKCLANLQSLFDETLPGDVVLSGEAKDSAGDVVNGKALHHGVIVQSIEPRQDTLTPSRSYYISQMISDHGESISRLVPRALPKQSEVFANPFVDDTSLMTVMLLRLDGLRWDDNDIHFKADFIQERLKIVQEAVTQRYAGSLCDFFFGDQGLVMLILFGARLHANGLPKFEAHAAVKAAFMAVSHLATAQCVSTVALSSGLVFAGQLGGTDRVSQLAVGNAVSNAAAMLSSIHDSNQIGAVYTDLPTAELVTRNASPDTRGVSFTSVGEYLSPLSDNPNPFYMASEGTRMAIK